LTWLIIFAIYIVVVGLQSYTIRLKKICRKDQPRAWEDADMQKALTYVKAR